MLVAYGLQLGHSAGVLQIKHTKNIMLKRSSYLAAALVSGLSTPAHAGYDELNEFMEAFTVDGYLLTVLGRSLLIL